MPVVFVRVAEGRGTEWVEAWLLAAHIPRRGPTALHLSFPERCPDRFFLAATEVVGADGHCRGGEPATGRPAPGAG